MIFEEFRWNTAIECITLIVIATNDTILICITERYSHRYFLTDASRHGNIMVHTKCRTVNLVLPIGIAATHYDIIWNTRNSRNKCSELISTQYFQTVGSCTQSKIGRVIELRCTIGSFFCSNNNDTIRSSRTIDCRSRSIFQDGKGLYIIRVYTTDKVSSALNRRVVNRYSINNN